MIVFLSGGMIFFRVYRACSPFDAASNLSKRFFSIFLFTLPKGLMNSLCSRNALKHSIPCSENWNRTVAIWRYERTLGDVWPSPSTKLRRRSLVQTRRFTLDCTVASPQLRSGWRPVSFLRSTDVDRVSFHFISLHFAPDTRGDAINVQIFITFNERLTDAASEMINSGTFNNTLANCVQRFP